MKVISDLKNPVGLGIIFSTLLQHFENILNTFDAMEKTDRNVKLFIHYPFNRIAEALLTFANPNINEVKFGLRERIIQTTEKTLLELGYCNGRFENKNHYGVKMYKDFFLPHYLFKDIWLSYGIEPYQRKDLKTTTELYISSLLDVYYPLLEMVEEFNKRYPEFAINYYISGIPGDIAFLWMEGLENESYREFAGELFNNNELQLRVESFLDKTLPIYKNKRESNLIIPDLYENLQGYFVKKYIVE